MVEFLPQLSYIMFYQDRKLCLSTNDEKTSLMSVHKNISQNAEFSDTEILRI